MTTTSTVTLDTTALSRAIEARDAEGILAWYAPDATLTILDRDHPPSAPLIHTGIAEIARYYRDVCGRNMEHQVRDAVATTAGLAYTQYCRYTDGAGVVCAAVCTVRDGRIRTQTAIQVWDS
jgi:ketosteroid isomerase-like protein